MTPNPGGRRTGMDEKYSMPTQEVISRRKQVHPRRTAMCCLERCTDHERKFVSRSQALLFSSQLGRQQWGEISRRFRLLLFRFRRRAHSATKHHRGRLGSCQLLRTTSDTEAMCCYQSWLCAEADQRSGGLLILLKVVIRAWFSWDLSFRSFHLIHLFT